MTTKTAALPLRAPPDAQRRHADRGAAILTESQKPIERRRIDGVGMLLLMVAVGAVALAIVESRSPAWQRAELGLADGLGVAAGTGFVLGARKAPVPLVDLAPFQHRTYRYVNLARSGR